MEHNNWVAPIVQAWHIAKENPVKALLFCEGILSLLERTRKILKPLAEIVLAILLLPLLVLALVVISLLPERFFVVRAAQSYDAFLPAIKVAALYSSLALVLGIGLYFLCRSRRLTA